MERIAKIDDDWKPLTIFAKYSIFDVWQGSEYVSEALFTLVVRDNLNNIYSKVYWCYFDTLLLTSFTFESMIRKNLFVMLCYEEFIYRRYVVYNLVMIAE